MSTYSDEDCLAGIQLAAWMTGKSETDLTVSLYRSLGMKPTARTILNRFDGWGTATAEAETAPQQIPSHLSDFYRAVAALRRARDLGGHPVTGLKYRDQLDIEVSYIDVLQPFRSWTQAKIIAQVHSPGEGPWEEIEPLEPTD